jgi:hypothetical protein
MLSQDAGAASTDRKRQEGAVGVFLSDQYFNHATEENGDGCGASGR